MGLLNSSNSSDQRSFLPEDYIQRRAERRTLLISAVLFGVVAAGVVGAFFVTNREWNDVAAYQRAVNVRYTQAAEDIEQLKKLEEQKGELLDKAELTTVLIERVPKSILFAELINRMPPDMTMLEAQTKSTRLEAPRGRSGKKSSAPPGEKSKGTGKGSSMAQNKKGRDSKEGAATEAPEVSAPKLETRLVLIGVAPSHNSVARYVSALQACPLLRSVEMKFSEETIIRDLPMNKFRLEAMIRPDADGRRLEPAANPRLNASVTDSGAPAATPQADASEGEEKEGR